MSSEQYDDSHRYRRRRGRRARGRTSFLEVGRHLWNSLRSDLRVIFPFVAPLVGLTASVGAVVGVVIGVVAIVFNIMSIRRFFKADHPYKWWASALNFAVIILLVVLFVLDSQTLLG